MSALAICKAELRQALAGLPRSSRFNVWAFQTQFAAWRDALSPARTSAKRQAYRFVDRLEPRGATNLYDPLEAALLDPEVQVIYLLSDGAPNYGQLTRPDEILRVVRRLNAIRHVRIHCVGVGPSQPGWFLERLATENDGLYVRFE